MRPWLTAMWRATRQLSGDDAYERYLVHFAQHHAGELDADGNLRMPLPKQAFFRQWQDNKWTGIKRCC